MRYIVVKAESLQVFVDEVNSTIASGFEPFGGITSHGGEYMQALVSNSLPKQSDPDIVNSGVVPGSSGPEFVVNYVLDGKQDFISMGTASKIYSDEDIFRAIKAK